MNTIKQKTTRTEAVLTRGLRLNSVADTALKGSATLWFLVAVMGQWMFAYYVASFYGGSAIQGNWEVWNKDLTHGYVPGDPIGNMAIVMHLLLAVVVMVGGPLQFIPQLRTLAPSFHHWNGRIYILTAFPISMAGLYMLWVHGTVGDLSQHIGISLDAVLIMLCAALAWRYALARDFNTHRRWALRLFLVMNGVWFFRIGFMLWVVLNNGPAGFDPETFQGPFLTFLAFAQTLLPLAILELYLRTQDRAGATGRFAMAVGLFVLTIATGIGIFAATMGMWLPKL